MMEKEKVSDKVHLVFASDENFMFYTAVAAMSAKVTASRPNDLVIHILDSGITDESWEKWNADIGAVRHHIDFSKYRFLKGWKGSLAAYSRLFIPEILSDVDWCVYSDADVLFTDDIFSLANKYVSVLKSSKNQGGGQEIAVWGAQDLLWRDMLISKSGDWYEKCPVDREKYICSGFMIMNLSFLREYGLAQNAFACLKENPESPFADQCVINHLLHEKIKFLDYRWGGFPCYMSTMPNHPGALHFVTDAAWKPTFSFTCGYKNGGNIWKVFAEVFFGMSSWEYQKVSVFKYVVGRSYNIAMVMMFYLTVFFPSVQKRFVAAKESNVPARFKYLMTKRYWKNVQRKSMA